MDILSKIIIDKKIEIDLKKQLLTTKQLEKYPLFERHTISLIDKINNSNYGIIAEHKRRSPSNPSINQKLSVYDVVKGYEDAGASGISILTDAKYFGGSLEDLLFARASCHYTPILRKEFIIDEYQVIEAKAYGADAILLIANILTTKEIIQFSKLAQLLGLQILLEIHDLEELRKVEDVCNYINILGVNNRNLKTFNTTLNTSKRLSKEIPDNLMKISESGIYNIEDIKILQEFGFKGFLIGEKFMRTENPGKELLSFTTAV